MRRMVLTASMTLAMIAVVTDAQAQTQTAAQAARGFRGEMQVNVNVMEAADTALKCRLRGAEWAVAVVNMAERQIMVAQKGWMEETKSKVEYQNLSDDLYHHSADARAYEMDLPVSPMDCEDLRESGQLEALDKAIRERH